MGLFSHLLLILTTLVVGAAITVQFANNTSTSTTKTTKLTTTTVPHNHLSAKHKYDRIVVFGDSLSDNGTNGWIFSNKTWPEDPAYFQHRFSNGPVWVESLATKLNADLLDFAIAGATSNNSVVQGFMGLKSDIRVPCLLDQLESFVRHNTVSSNDLYAFMIGANDILFSSSIDGVIPALNSVVEQLYKKGATRFIFLSYGSLGLLPFRAYAPSDVSDRFDRLSTQLQTSLLSLRYRLCRGLGLHVGFADIHTLFHKMTSTPSDYGFDETRVGISCLIGAFDEAPRSLCTDPDKYIFWDEYHPTKVVHQYIAALAWKASQDLCDRYLANRTKFVS